ncbi:MAG: ABC transporter ATP-binding protein [Baekduia sp.]
MKGATVDATDVWRTYDGRVNALAGATFSITAGEFIVITGPSGSGKSTLLQLVGSLDRVDRGTLLVDGAPVPYGRHAVDYRRHVVGFVFQLHHLLPMLTAQANVEVGLLAAGVHAEDRHARARELLEEVELSHRIAHRPPELSGGERQRVAVARALANHPRLLLADEPTGALDTDGTVRMLDLLDTLRERHGMTLMIVTHDPVVAERADRGIHLVDGRVENASEPAAR